MYKLKVKDGPVIRVPPQEEFDLQTSVKTVVVHDGQRYDGEVYLPKMAPQGPSYFPAILAFPVGPLKEGLVMVSRYVDGVLTTPFDDIKGTIFIPVYYDLRPRIEAEAETE